MKRPDHKQQTAAEHSGESRILKTDYILQIFENKGELPMMQYILYYCIQYTAV